MENNNKEKINITNKRFKNIMNYIYDEQFINLVNSVSSSIKDYFKNNKLYMNNLKICIDGINEQTLFTKSAVNDILVYLNQISKSKLNVSNTNMNEKYIKEKLYSINERINKINQCKNNLIENLKNSDMTFINFYEEQQNLFNKMKIIQNKNLNNFHSEIFINNYDKNHSRKNYNTVSHSPKNKNLDINNYTLISRNKKNFTSSLNNSSNNFIKEDDYSKLKLQYNELYKEYENLKNLLLKRKNPNNNLKKLIPSNSNSKGIKLNKRSQSFQKNNSLNNEIQNNTNSRNIKLIKNNILENNSLEFNRYTNKNDKIDYTNMNIIKSNDNIESKNKNNLINQEIPNSNSHDSYINNKNLASMVLNFLNNMKLLQESISKKLDNVQELKKNFEIKKKI